MRAARRDFLSIMELFNICIFNIGHVTYDRTVEVPIVIPLLLQ